MGQVIGIYLRYHEETLIKVLPTQTRLRESSVKISREAFYSDSYGY